jgi:succinoglycan biosynthesis transport protein ExoP
MSFDLQAEPQMERPVDGRENMLVFNERRSLMDMWRVLTKQRFTILAVTLLSVAAAAWVAFRTAPVYESVARIEIKPNTLASSDQVGMMEEYTENPLQSDLDVIKSDSVLFQTAMDLHLDRLKGAGHQESGAGESASSAAITPQEHRALVGMIRGGLSVTIVPNTDILEIRYRNNDPKLSAAVANQLMETYSDEDIRTRYERTMHVSAWLQQRLDNLKQEASETQRQLADYQKAHNIVGTDESSNLTIQTLQHVSDDLNTAESDRIMKEARMRDFNSLSPDMAALAGDDPTLVTLRSQLNDFETQRAQMATKLGPKHPQMQQIDLQIDKLQAQISKETELARHQVRDEYESALGVEADLRKRLAAQEDATYRLNEDVAQYAILRHQAELTRDLYDNLQMKLKEASVSAGMSAANITVVDRAEVPFIPVEPQKGRALGYGFFGGLLVGCVLAFVIESIDDRLQTSEEVENASRLPSLAAIPHLMFGAATRKGDRGEEIESGAPATLKKLVIIQEPQSHGAEAYRSMRSALMLSSIDSPPRVIVLTSAFPAEGKTTTALNLAVALAQRGERVLLVDADLRRGSLHRVFGLEDHSVGLSTALSQPGTQMELPNPIPELPTLYVLATGPRPPNPAEMLSSRRMEEQMRQWTHQFDRIVIDTAPLLAVSDTQAMAVRADAVVLVARAGVTRKRALVRARDLLWRINAPVCGVVINDVEMRLEYFYTYRYAKHYWYGYRRRAASSDRAYGYEEEEVEK